MEKLFNLTFMYKINILNYNNLLNFIKIWRFLYGRK